MYVLFRCKFTLVIFYHFATRYFQRICYSFLTFTQIFINITSLPNANPSWFVTPVISPFRISSNVSHMAFPRTKRVEREKKEMARTVKFSRCFRIPRERSAHRNAQRRKEKFDRLSLFPPSSSFPAMLRHPATPSPLDPLDCLPFLFPLVRTRVAFAWSKIANRMCSYRPSFTSMTRGAS